jgi:Animal haem peroxidase
MRPHLRATLTLVALFGTAGTTPLPARGQLIPTSPVEYRAIDGTGNNAANSAWGSAGSEFLRMMPVAYADGISAPPTADLPGPRAVSNAVCAQGASIPNREGYSDFLWQWGQFLDHDMTLTFSQTPFEPFMIPVPAGDPYFDPAGTGTQMIELTRSQYLMDAGVRQQMNSNTSYIDGSMVYGSDLPRSMELRALDGTGMLKTTRGDLLPYNLHGFPNFPDDYDQTMFLAGDVRANEQVGLTAMHTLFMREHNYYASAIHSASRRLDDETVYQMARMLVGAEIQAITYREFLPTLLGPDALRPYDGYHPEVNATMENEFATAAYRMGHTLLSPQLLRLDRKLRTIREGNLPLKDAFFTPSTFVSGGGPEPLLRGLATQRAQEFDAYVVDGVRNFLFGPPGAGGFDLASLNVQRGRDHGLPRFNDARAEMGMPRAMSFSDISSDPEVQAHLASVYASVDDVDFWIGAISEDHHPGAVVGELVFRVLKAQFERQRDGDRLWYQNALPPLLVKYVEHQTLATIIRRNTGIRNEISDDVFHVRDAVLAASLPASEVRARSDFAIGRPYPNPARGDVALGFAFPGSESREVLAEVFDVQGRKVRTVLQGVLPGGAHRIVWDRLDGDGRAVPGGIYFLRVRSGEAVATARVLVLK